MQFDASPFSILTKSYRYLPQSAEPSTGSSSTAPPIVTVDKLFLHTIVQYLHIRRTVVTGNLLAKATVQHSVLKSNDQCMVALQVIEQSLVHTRDVARIDKRGIHSFLFLQPGSHGFAQLIERAQSQYGDLLSTMGPS